jgi:8-amino-7-oxononanoate synthase
VGVGHDQRVAVRDHLVNTARPFIYDTGLAPAAAGGALAALHVIEAEPYRLARDREVACLLTKAGGVAEPAGAVLAIATPGPREAVDAVAHAAALGVRIGCFRPPSTPDGISRLRLTAHAHLTDAEVEQATRVLESL